MDTLIFSRHSGIYEAEDDEVEVNIFKPGDGSGGWSLEVVTSESTTIRWETVFASDDDALEEFLTAFEDGMGAFAEEQLCTVH
jgi:hypothetical protein